MEDDRPSNQLLDLPFHIRDGIYRHVLALPSPIHSFQDTPAHKVEVFATDRPTDWLALLHTNGKLSFEANKVLYLANHFVLIDTAGRQADLLGSFLDGIGPANARCVTRLTFTLPVTQLLEALKATDTAPKA